MLDQWKTFPITHTMMFAILKVSVKLQWADLGLLNLDQKMSIVPMYCFEYALNEKRYTPLLEPQFKLFGLMQYFFEH